MCRAAFALIMIVCLLEPATAQRRFATSHPQPTAASTQEAYAQPVPDDPRITGAIANAEARKRMDTFDNHIETSANRVLGSICPACTSDAKLHKWTARRIEASADGPEILIRDPAQAPID